MPGVDACSAAIATFTLCASVVQAAAAELLVTPPRAKTTIALHRIPSTTMTIRSSMSVNPRSPFDSTAALNPDKSLNRVHQLS